MRGAVSARRAALVVLVVAALGAGGYALASPGPARSPFAPGIACAGGRGRLLSVSGRVPAGVAAVYLAYASGASMQANVDHRAYRFLIAGAGAGAGLPERLEYVDGAGHRHAQQLSRDSYPTCARASRPLLFSTQAATRRPQTPLDRAIDLVNEARLLAQRTSPACGDQSVPPPKLTLSTGSPSEAILRVLGVLRSTPTRHELRFATRSKLAPLVGGPPGVLTVYRRYVRIVKEPGGITATIVVGVGEESLPRSALYPCLRAATRDLERLVRGHPRAIGRLALNLERGYKLGPQTRGFHPWLDYGGAGGTGGPFDVTNFRKNGLMIEGGGLEPPPGFNPKTPSERSKLKFRWSANGLVPDGVATVTLKLTGRSTHLGALGGPGAAGTQGFAHPYQVTVPVIENTFLFDNLPADANSAAHQTIIWRAANGRVLRVIH